jgi:hypothetical protein
MVKTSIVFGDVADYRVAREQGGVRKALRMGYLLVSSKRVTDELRGLALVEVKLR